MHKSTLICGVGNQDKPVPMYKKCMATVSSVTSQGGYLYPPAADGVDRVQTFIDNSQSVFRENVEEK